MEDDSPYEVSIVRAGVDQDVSDRKLVDVVEATLRLHHVSKASISVALVDDPQIAELNAAHLGHDGPTDVLTFDLRDEKTQSGGSPNNRIEGEIVVSVDTAAREAKSRGHDITTELALYAVHGTLHLLGFDDQASEDAARMHGLEDDILSSLGVGPVYRRSAK
ncbi:MAG: rRNA maturation RNase YbeY [Planctomycetes bacterium]|nr:rRNA maturation RNase YbeY [Planctomycetota bacterium]